MSSKVALSAVSGELTGREFLFEERTTCILGRSKDCHICIPVDAAKTVSRHHCLLDINPPDVRIRDFGSLNGTYVNGKKIGQRESHQTPAEAAANRFPEHELKHGDNILLGNVAFHVSIRNSPLCVQCRAEIPNLPNNVAPADNVNLLCEACRIKAERERSPRRTRAEVVKLCVQCGRDVAAEAGSMREGEYTCSACRADPFQLLRSLLHQANRGDNGMAAIEGYDIIRELGCGGMGAVYLAKQASTNRQVALKVMLPRVAASPTAIERFRREIDNSKALRHPNVVQVFDSGCSHGTFFFTLEYCDVGSVDKLMEHRGGRLSIDEASKIILQALDGLHYAHHAAIPNVKLKDGRIGQGRGLVHRDLKPHNIFLSNAGGACAAKLGDYGLAKAFDLAGLSGHTFTGDIAGTPHFMPRQQVLKFLEAQPEVDVWATAASLYNMLTGRVPREFPSTMDVWQAVLQTDPVPIRNRNPSIPQRLAEVIDHALHDKPKIGFSSAAEFKEALLGAL
jgi:eukaryotic-like serine/threonine-protein kinase